MARVVFQSTSPLGQPKMFLRNWGPSLGMWGFGAGTAALFVLSVTPVVRNNFLTHIPVLGDYFEDKTPASDKPF